MKKIQVSYLGLNSLFGRVTTNLLKQSPCIEKLSLYDDDDTSLLEDGANVFIGRDQLPDAVKDVNIVVIGDEPCDTHGEERLKIIGPKIIRYTEAILKSSPNAVIVVAASPLNILVPLVGNFLGPDWHHRLLGITSVDTLRASRILNGLLNNPLGQAHILPVVGGSSATSRVPLFSHLHPNTVICNDIREKILEKMKSFDNAKYREMDSVERAYSAVRFIHSVISGMLKDSPIPEIAMTKTTEVPNADFFSLPMLIGKNGIENAIQLPKFDEAEEKLFLEATERLAEDSKKARDFINSLAQESVRNSNTSNNVSEGKRLTWNERSQFSNDPQHLPKDDELPVKGDQETASSAEVASTQCKSQKLNKVNYKVCKVNSESRDFDGNNSAQSINNPYTGESRSFTYRLWAKPCGSDKESQEVQTFSRKSIPICPSYKLIPESSGVNCDSRIVVGDGKTELNLNKNVEPTERIATLKSAEDSSSGGSKVWKSPTRTALETSNRTDAFKEHDVPQPSTIMTLNSAEDISSGGGKVWKSHRRMAPETYNRTDALKKHDVPQPSTITTLNSAEDSSSGGGKVWTSPTITAQETSNRTDAFKEHDVPQSSTITTLNSAEDSSSGGGKVWNSPTITAQQTSNGTDAFKKHDVSQPSTITTLKSAEDSSSEGDNVWKIPMGTALEMSNRTDAFKEHDVPQPSAVQHLVHEVTQLEPSSTDSHPQTENTIERRPHLTESDVSANDGMDSDCTETLLEEVGDHLGALGKYADSFACIEDRKNEIVHREAKHLKKDDRFMSPENDGRDTKQGMGSEPMELAVSPNNNEISSGCCSHKLSKPKVDIQVVSRSKPEIERNAMFSDLSNSHKASRNARTPNYESTPQYLNRDRMISTKKYDIEENVPTDSKIVSGKKENTRSTELRCAPVDDEKYQQDGDKSIFSSFKNNFDKRSVQKFLHDKCRLEEDVPIPNQESEEIIRKRWKKKLSDENMWASSLDVIAFNNRHKNMSNKSTGKLVNGKRKPQSRRSVSNEDRTNQPTKDRYPIGFPNALRISKKSAAAKTVASEERILCLSNDRIENSFNKNSFGDSIKDGQPRKPGNKEWLKPENPPLKSMNPSEEDFGKPEMLLRLKGKAFTSNSSSGVTFPTGASSTSKIVKEMRWPKNGNDSVSSNLLAAKSRETDSCDIVKDMKRGLCELGQSHSSQYETPLKLLNLPGCKHRYETSLKISEFEERQKDATTDVDCNSDATKTDLTSGKTKGYFMRERRGSVPNDSNANDNLLNLEGSQKKRSRKKCKRKETPTQKRKSNKASSQLAGESKKVDHKKPQENQSTAAVNQCGTPKKLERTVSKNTVTKNSTNRKKNEQNRVSLKSSDSTKEDVWESKYFTKASEMFFRMFRDSVANNKVSFERAKVKTSDVHNEGIDAKKKVQEAKPSLSGVSGIQPTHISTKDVPSPVEAVKINRNLPLKNPAEVFSARDFTKPDGPIEKPKNNKVGSTISEIKKAKILKANVDNDEKLKTKNKMSYGTQSKVSQSVSGKSTEGPSVNKLNMLQSTDGRSETEIPAEEKKATENSVFNTKITGMEKYQIEKNDNMKKEITSNSPIDVEKLFEESSTIPVHSFSGSDGKMWQSPGVVSEKGTKPGFANHQSILQGANATSDKGRGDAVNMIDFSICKSPFLGDQGSLRYEIGKTRVNTLLQKNSSTCRTSQPSPAPKPCSSVKNDTIWRAPVVSVPISSKNIKQVYPQNYKEQILNSSVRKMDDEIPRTEKTNKWERILTIFKQIIIRDLEDERPGLARSVEAAKSLNEPPVQLRETVSKASYSPLKSSVGGNPVPNQKILKGKVSSKVKKKTEIVKKKLPAETTRRNTIIKNNPKKIVSYFSKRGQACSAYEKPGITNFTVNSFEQTQSP